VNQVPRVSVIIPTYNRKDYVREAIDSVLAQTYTDYEIIVVDDGSSDGTEAVLRERYGDRIRYLWQENQGESVARNRGIELA
jgi:glycosyltransferase involved in cell wall biosynthesis